MTLAWEINVPFLLLLFHICVCAYPHLSMWSFYIQFEADNHKMVYIRYARQGQAIKGQWPNYNHV